MRKSQNGVTVSTEPSANLAFTVNWPNSPGLRNAYSAGVTINWSISPLPLVRVAPRVIQSWKIWYCHEPLVKRAPPSCGTWPVGFVSSRLLSGSTGLIRRPILSRVSELKSLSGSNPKSDSRKPFLPWKEPWQEPELQPILLNRPIICRSKSTFLIGSAPGTSMSANSRELLAKNSSANAIGAKPNREKLAGTMPHSSGMSIGRAERWLGFQAGTYSGRTATILGMACSRFQQKLDGRAL